jgi:hypothetical protein
MKVGAADYGCQVNFFQNMDYRYEIFPESKNIINLLVRNI